MAAALVGVGVGPGDPELLTTRALRTLREAGTVFGPTLAVDAVGRAESIVRQAAPDVVVERLRFDINGTDAERTAAHDDAAAMVAARLDEGQRVAFITLGDPNVYSTFPHLAEAVLRIRPHTPVETVPGIMAFQDLASRSGTVVVDGTERLHLVTAMGGPADLGDVVHDRDAAVVVYKGGRHLPAIAEHLEQAGRLDGAVYGELLGLPGERLGPVKEHAGGPGAYLATVIVPPARTNEAGT